MRSNTTGLLVELYEAAFNKNHGQVIENLKKVPARTAVLYAENMMKDKEAAEFIKNLAYCECGGVAVTWIDTLPLCGNKGFSRAMEKIEYINRKP